VELLLSTHTAWLEPQGPLRSTCESIPLASLLSTSLPYLQAPSAALL
jgi:hypothetical protein